MCTWNSILLFAQKSKKLISHFYLCKYCPHGQLNRLNVIDTDQLSIVLFLSYILLSQVWLGETWKFDRCRNTMNWPMTTIVPLRFEHIVDLSRSLTTINRQFVRHLVALFWLFTCFIMFYFVVFQIYFLAAEQRKHLIIIIL